MSLYYETAPFILPPADDSNGGSLKSRIFSASPTSTTTPRKSQPKHIYALAVQTAKWSPVLAELIENSRLLELEQRLTPPLSLLLVHDLLISSKGVAAPKNHPLRTAVEKHRARLLAELTRIRVWRKCATLEKLGALLETENYGDQGEMRQPRWVRVNTLKTTVEEQMKTTFREYTVVKSLGEVQDGSGGPFVCRDAHVPNLLALPPMTDLTKSSAYFEGKIILQDKASCFPAYLLNHQPGDGDAIDACAAPGNKTTHLAAIANAGIKGEGTVKVYACERDKERAKTLVKMVEKAGAKGTVKIMAGQNFLDLDSSKAPWSKVTSLLLDPSCSGSGIVGRDEVAKVTLPQRTGKPDSTKSKVRGNPIEPQTPQAAAAPPAEVDEAVKTKDMAQRLEALSSLQLRLLLHAMSFPAANKISYSTCSLHAQENEHVVCKALSSSQAIERGWTILQREDQVDGMARWPVRGDRDACRDYEADFGFAAADTIAEGCIRCEKGTEEGTQGFFVAGFVRDAARAKPADANGTSDHDNEWHGFDD